MLVSAGISRNAWCCLLNPVRMGGLGRHNSLAEPVEGKDVLRLAEQCKRLCKERIFCGKLRVECGDFREDVLSRFNDFKKTAAVCFQTLFREDGKHPKR